MQIIDIPPLDQFGEIYTIEFPSGRSNMVQSEIFELAPATSISTITRQSPEKCTEIEAPTVTIKIFVTIHKEHPHTTFTGKWNLTSSQNI